MGSASWSIITGTVDLSSYSSGNKGCFREDGEAALRYINGTRLDDRIIRTDWDAGFIEGRQYGRGKSGGQVGRQG